MAESGASSGSLPPSRRQRRTPATAGDDASEEVEQQQQQQRHDRFNLLPDPIIHHIFSFLPTRDVCRTRAVSTWWCALCDANTLAFSLPGGSGGGGGGGGGDGGGRDSTVDRFCSWVDAVLDRRRSSTDIARFYLKLPYLTSTLKSKLEPWLRFAAECCVKDLRVELPRSENLDQVLRVIRDCPSLVELRLCGGRMGLGSSGGVVNWTSLRVLSMAYLRLTDGEIGAVFEGSPALESLELQCCGGATRIEVRSRKMRELVIDGWKHLPRRGSPLEISAPYLQTLRLRGKFPRMDLRLAEASSVAEAELNFSMSILCSDFLDNYGRARNLAREILQKLRNATKFVVGCWCLQVLSLLEDGDLPPPLPNCKYLILNTRCQLLECHGILNMMESSPQMEKLVIKMIQPFWKSLEFDRDCKLLVIGTQRYSVPLRRNNVLQCLDQHLRRVDIVRFDPRDHHLSSFLGLVEFILEEARVLDRMVINACKVKADGSNSGETPNPHKLLEVSQSILRHRRASKNARVELYFD